MNDQIKLLSKLDLYPKIRDRIIMLWGSKELKDYLASLLEDTRENSRQGFSQHVYNTILELSNMNTKLLEDARVIEKNVDPLDFKPSTWYLPRNF